MQIEKLLEKQEKEFVKKYNSSVLLAYPEYAESHMILLTDIWNWHKQSLKQFIDGLVEREEGEIREFKVTGDGEYHFGENQKVIGWNMAKEYTISNLKEIKKQLELEVVDNSKQ